MSLCKGCGGYGLHINEQSFCADCEYVKKFEKTLDEACELLKKTETARNHYHYDWPDCLEIKKLDQDIDTFLSQTKTEKQDET